MNGALTFQKWFSRLIILFVIWNCVGLRYTVSSNLELFTFDAAHNMDLIEQPLLMMAGSKADTLDMTEAAFAAATGASDKELFLIEGATHIQTYWMPQYVNQAVEKLTAFYGKHL